MRISVLKPLALMVVTLALITTFITLIKVGGFLAFSAQPALATCFEGGCGDQCGQEFPYERTDSWGDLNDWRVEIDFRDYRTPSGPDNDGYYKITVLAKSGYQIVDILLDVSGDGEGGYSQHFTSGLNDYNPTGDQINKVKVLVRKVCASPSPSPSVSPSPSPSVSPSPSTDPSPSGDPEPSESPLPTATPGDVCTNIDGFQSSIPDGYYVNTDSTVCLQFQYGGPQVPSSGTGGQVLGTTSEVLGASTLAATGTFESQIFSALFALGASLIGVGIRKKASL